MSQPLPATPVPVVAARVVATVQAVLALLLAAVGALLAVAAGASDPADPTDSTAIGWADLGTALGVAAAVVGGVTCVLLAGPLVVMAGRSTGRRQTGRVLLIGSELLVGLGPWVLTERALGVGGPGSSVVAAWTLASLAVAGCLLATTSSRWATR